MSIEGLKYDNSENRNNPEINREREAGEKFNFDIEEVRNEAETLAKKNKENTRRFLDNIDFNFNAGFNKSFPNSFEKSIISNYDRGYFGMMEYYRQEQNLSKDAGTYLHLSGAQEADQKFMFSLFPDDPFLNEKYSKYLENIKPEDYSKISPLDIILKVAENSSQDEKIKLAQVVTAYGGGVTYDYDMLKRDIKTPWNAENIPKEEYWRLLREGGLTGVCRHIHRAGAEILSGLGMEAGVVTVSSGVKHAVTIGKKDDGSYFLIDYGRLYEAKSVERLISDYSAFKGAVDLQTFFSDSEGKFVGLFRTELQKAIAKNTHVIGDSNSLEYSGNLLKNRNLQNIKEGLTIDSDVSNNSGKVSAIYGFSGGNREVGVDGSFSKLSDGTTLKTAGISYRDKAKIFDGTLQNNIKLTGSQISFYNGNEALYGGLSLNTSYVKDIYKTDDLKVSGAGSFSSQISANLGKNKKTFLNDGQGDLGGSLRVDKKITENLSGYLQGGIGGDLGIENIGGGKITLYGKNYIEGGVTYKTDEVYVSALAGQSNGLEGKRTYGKLEAFTEKYSASFEGSYLNRSKNPFLPNETNFTGNLGYKVNKNTTLNINAGMKKQGDKKSSTVGAGVSVRF